MVGALEDALILRDAFSFLYHSHVEFQIQLFMDRATTYHLSKHTDRPPPHTCSFMDSWRSVIDTSIQSHCLQF